MRSWSSKPSEASEGSLLTRLICAPANPLFLIGASSVAKVLNYATAHLHDNGCAAYLRQCPNFTRQPERESKEFCFVVGLIRDLTRSMTAFAGGPFLHRS